ncbi:MAG: DUF6798 domain-containing protein [Rhodothermales bacterium]
MKPFRRRHDKKERRYEERAPFFVLLGALLLFFLRFGYEYGVSDQDEVIPYLLHRLDPGLFTQDWFVQLQVSEFSIRTYFVWLLNIFAIILPIWLAALIIHVAAWLAAAAAIYRLGYHFTRDQLAGCAAVVLVLVLTPVWTLGGNEVVHSMLVASMVAWAIGLWAVYHFLRGRYLIAPVLLGVACWIQALVGLHLAILLLLIRAFKYVRGEPGSTTFGGIVVFGALFLMWSSPALGPIVYQQIFLRPENFNPDPSIFYILAEFRLPHHYLPTSFYPHSLLRFGLLTLFGSSVLLSRGFRRSLTDHDFITRVLFLIAGICVIAAVFTELVPSLFVAKLQFFKMTVLAKVLFLIALSAFVFYWMPEGIRRPLHSLLNYPRWGLALVALAWAVVMWGTISNDGFLREKVGPFRRAEEPVGRVETWAKSQTPTDAIFAVPPSWSGFRSAAHRTIVVNFKAIPFQDDLMVSWFGRLTDMAPIDPPDRGGPGIIDELDAAYEGLTADDLLRLSETYRFNYVIRSGSLEGTEFESVFRSGPWWVYRRAPPAVPMEDVLPEDVPAEPGQ